MRRREEEKGRNETTIKLRTADNKINPQCCDLHWTLGARASTLLSPFVITVVIKDACYEKI